MNSTKRILFLGLLLCFILGCEQNREARRPISQSSGSFMKESIIRNKKLVATEEDRIQAVIKKSANTKFRSSTKGYWYYYDQRNFQDTLTPTLGDVAFFDYEVKDLDGNLIYSKEETKPQTYYVDKQNIMIGLRDGIKMMRKKETFVFLFPSHIAYGYHGDEKKIGTNVPLLCTVTLHNFVSETKLKEREENKAKAVLRQKEVKEIEKPETEQPQQPESVLKDSLN